LNENFSQSREQLLQKKAIERGRLVKREHKQEKRKEKEMTHGQEGSAQGKGAQAKQPLVATPPFD
jgi:hypothetical protein